ncbi:DUF1102 domain-containing protein [Halobacterium bonnevillei]|uniref:DUF1102 domain-containing protein n=1 Tax=Halobacterium bonnevillei TaxID=2692200 RepID=A0A6B0SEF1_9EURY|nr:DUF1102 domain-containing protein [Halobacterium bonnevillei]MXR20105.1 DUF1102 domain-containing protein [Halobacterium bonnevillei]
MTNRARVLTFAVALVVTVTLVFPSGATPLFERQTDSVGSSVELAPSSDYASLDEGELVVEVSASNPKLAAAGLNPNSVTTFDDVFRVQYTGSEYADVWLSHGADSVTFSVDGEPVESEANNVSLAPNESVAVGMVVDTRGETPGGLIDDITVHATVADAPGVRASDAPEIEFDGPIVQSRAPTEDSRRFAVLGASTGSVYTFDANGLVLDRAAGATLELETVVVGNDDGSLSFGIDAVEGASSRTLVRDAGPDPLGVARVDVGIGRVSNATLRFSAADEYLAARDTSVETLAVYRNDDGALSALDVSVTERRDGRAYFEADAPGFSSFVVAADRARLAVAQAALGQTTVQPGDPVAVTATVANDGTISGERRIAVTVDGTVAAERTVAVDAGETASVTVPVARNDTGEYDVAVDGVDAGSFVVEPSDGSAGSRNGQSGSSDVSTPESVAEEPAGFGLDELVGLVTLLGLIAATLFLARRAPWR